MGWAKVDDQFYDNPKIARVGNAGAGLYIKGLAYCCRHLTDGEIPGPWAEKEAAGDDGLVQRLVDAGLWESVDERDAYRIPDFLEFNPSRERVLSRREEGAQRVRDYRGRSNDDVTQDVTRYKQRSTRGRGTGPGKGSGSEGKERRKTSGSVARAKVDGKPVTDAERELAEAIIAAFNQAADTSYTADAHLTPVVMRIRQRPDLDADDHRRIVAANFASPWWTDHPGPEVIYGNARQFERSCERARGGSVARRDEHPADARMRRLDEESQTIDSTAKEVRAA